MIRTDRITRALERSVSSGAIPGFVALVHHRGKEAFVAGSMHRDVVVRVASMTKPIIAAAVMTFVEEGIIRLYDPIDSWLPELANRRVLRDANGPIDDTVPSPRPIFLHDLMCFQTGIGWGPSTIRAQVFGMLTPPMSKLLNAPSEADLEPDAWLGKLGELPLVYAPGERWLYHVSAEILGVLLARLGKAPLEDVLRARVFEPLGMRNTGFYARVPSRLSTLYGKDEKGTLVPRDEPANSLWAKPPKFPSGGGGLVSTADDYVRFARMLLGNGALEGRRLLSRKSVEWMTTDHLSAAQHAHPNTVTIVDRFDQDRSPGMWDNSGFGYGLAVRTRRVGLGPNVGTLSWPGAFGTSWLVDPSEQLCAVFLTQLAGGNPFFTPAGEDFVNALYGALDE